MKRTVRVGVLLAVFAMSVLTLGDSRVMAMPFSFPLPPPPVLCGCACPDGSFVTTHAPSPNACPSACAAACQNSGF